MQGRRAEAWPLQKSVALSSLTPAVPAGGCAGRLGLRVRGVPRGAVKLAPDPHLLGSAWAPSWPLSGAPAVATEVAVSLRCAVSPPDLAITGEGVGGLSNTSWWVQGEALGLMTSDLLAGSGRGAGLWGPGCPHLTASRGAPGCDPRTWHTAGAQLMQNDQLRGLFPNLSLLPASIPHG